MVHQNSLSHKCDRLFLHTEEFRLSPNSLYFVRASLSLRGVRFGFASLGLRCTKTRLSGRVFLRTEE